MTLSIHDSARRVHLLHRVADASDDFQFMRDPATTPPADDQSAWVRLLVIALGNLGAADEEDVLYELCRTLGLGLAWAESISREEAR